MMVVSLLDHALLGTMSLQDMEFPMKERTMVDTVNATH